MIKNFFFVLAMLSGLVVERVGTLPLRPPRLIV